MSEYPSLVEVLADHIGEAITECAQLREGIGGPSTYEAIRRNSDSAVDAWREACAIHTIEDLDRVPARAIVKSAAGSIACRFDGRNGVVFGDDRPFPWHKLALPALLIWHPDWERP